MIDGIEVAGQCCMAALLITTGGRRREAVVNQADLVDISDPWVSGPGCGTMVG